MDTVALVGEGDDVVGQFRCTGTQTGPWMGRPATNRSFRDVREVYWFTVRGGHIIDWWGMEDNEDRRRQLRHPDGPA
jgi:predicted ester cyclase